MMPVERLIWKRKLSVELLRYYKRAVRKGTRNQAPPKYEIVDLNRQYLQKYRQHLTIQMSHYRTPHIFKQ
jgi:hypothetical protein